MSRISRNLAILLRSERMIARRNMSVLRNQSGILIFAAVVGAMGLVMLNIAAFFWLKTLWSPASAALVVAAANLVLAVILVFIATRMGKGSELEPMTEMRDMALEELEVEVHGVIGEVQDVAENVRRIAANPLGTALPALAIPLISALLNAMKKDDNDAK